MATSAGSPAAEAAYDAIAPAYDLLTGTYAYDRWLGELERLALRHGLAGNRLLDVACGTGESFLPLLTRGYQVTGCDISSGMLEVARGKAPDALLYRADMRALPRLGEFDLITCLDDALNYLLDVEDLEAALAGFARNLAPGGLAIWDLNTLAQYGGQFASDHILVDEQRFIGWRGTPGGSAGDQTTFEITIDVFQLGPDEHWQRSTSTHRQRHWPRRTIEQACAAARLRILDVRGQRPGAVIDGTLNELVHTKSVYVATTAGKEDQMAIGMP